MAVAVRIVAFPEDSVILVLAQMRAVQAVRGRKSIAAAEFDFERAVHHFPAPFAPAR